MGRGELAPGGRVVYLGGDGALSAQLRDCLTDQGAFVACAETAQVGPTVHAFPGAVLVLDARAGSVGHDIPAVLRQIAAAGEQQPVWVCIADPRDLTVRLHALRGGARACFSAAGSTDALCASLLDLAGATADAPYRVLVVDDQEVAALFATRVLEGAGMRVQAVSDALEVLDALERMRPDLVLMDLRMPGANGIELTRIIREHEEFHSLPVVFLSGEGDPALQLDALRVGGDDFLRKPVSVALLVQTVRRRIQSARQRVALGGGASGREPDTGLWSQAALVQRIDAAIATIAAHPEQSAGAGVLLLDVDPVGGQAVSADLLGGVFAEVVRALRVDGTGADVAARIGPTALGVLVRRAGATSLLACAERMRTLVAGHAWNLDGRSLTLTASVGIGLFLPPADNASTMLSRAKKACSKAREAGGGRCETYVPSVPQRDNPTRNDRMADLIREALNNDLLSLAYQPIVPLRQCQGERYDALLRLRTGDGELIPPFDFFPVARACGLMPEIDRWVIARALDDTLAGRDGHPSLQLFVRLSLGTAALPGMVDWLRDEIARRDLIRQRPALVFDLDDVAASLGQAHACFGGLRRLGLDICLNRMHDSREARQLMADLSPSAVRIAPDALKALPGPSLGALIEAIHACGAKAIAPGIEHPQDIATVWRCGVEFIQGNFVHPAGAGLDFDFMGAGLV